MKQPTCKRIAILLALMLLISLGACGKADSKTAAPGDATVAPGNSTVDQRPDNTPSNNSTSSNSNTPSTRSNGGTAATTAPTTSSCPPPSPKPNSRSGCRAIPPAPLTEQPLKTAGRSKV